MADIRKFLTVQTGPDNAKPIAVLATYKIDALMGSIIQLDGRQSYDPEGQPISWKWSFTQVPIGSEVKTTGFKDIRPRGMAVSFIPDKTGIYVVQLVVNDGELDSDPVTATVNIQLTRVPVGENIVPDAQFLWSYISNFWNLVEDREVITSIWSSTIQTIGAELIKLWGNDNNKSLATIQGTFQRRWQKFDTVTTVLQESDHRVIVGKTDSGTGGTTGSIGEEPGSGTTQVFYMPKGARGEVTKTDFTNLKGNYGPKGRVIVVNSDCFTIQRVSNENQVHASGTDGATTEGSDFLTSARATFETSGIQPGMHLLLKTGPNIAEYLVSSVFDEHTVYLTHLNGSTPSFSVANNLLFDIVTPYSVVVTDEESMVDGQVGVTWRIPNLLHIPSVNFEEIGVSTGDILVFEVTRNDLGLSAELRAQVVGVDRQRVGFEFSLDELTNDGTEVVSRDLIQQLVQDLQIVKPDATQAEIMGAAEALISFMPIGVNLASRPFSTYRITFKAKKIIHNKALVSSTDLVSVPALQETPKDPPTVLRENLDYIVEGGKITFVDGLFTLQDPAPAQLWAELSIFDNGTVIEQNFGRLVGLSRESLTAKKTRAPYLSAVKGLFFAMTNGPTVANIRLGLQILLGLPFTEERGLVLEIQDSFTKDSTGASLGRILIEDVDDQNKRTGFRRLYFYPTAVGLEVNPVTEALYAVGDIAERFAPLSKGVEVLDYIKDPTWWVRALHGLEIMKFFTFKVVIDGDVFDSNDVQFALEFVRSIKPAYTKVISTALMNLYDDIETDDALGSAASLRFYDNTWGLEATNKANDDNQQGFILWNAGSQPFETRTLKLLKDVSTAKVGASIVATSVAGWNANYVRARSTHLGTLPIIEGDILAILPGQRGAPLVGYGLYEIGSVTDGHTLELLQEASPTTPDTMDITALDEDLFEVASNLKCVIIRRGSNPVLVGFDLATTAVDDVGTSTSSGFCRNVVSIGDHLIIESGLNKGEYVIDAVNPAIPPSITETQVRLKHPDGSSPIFTAATGQTFRVVRPYMQARLVQGAKTTYNAGLFQAELTVMDPVLTTRPRDVFTPGMVGTYVEVSNSDNPANDGKYMITEYVHPGKVVLGFSSSTVSDTVAKASVYFT